jgi:hypothetical protein
MKETTSKTKVNVTNVPASDSKNEEGEIEMAKKNETIASEPITIRLNEKGVSKMRLSEITPIAITTDEFTAKSPQELVDLMIDRLSQERAKAELISRIREKRIKINEASTLMDWTYKNVTVEGVTAKVRGVKNAKVTLTADQFNSLTPEQKAAYVNQYAHKRRVAGDIMPQLIIKGMPITPRDLVWLTNERVTIEGVTIQNHNANGKRNQALTDGVEFA